MLKKKGPKRPQNSQLQKSTLSAFSRSLDTPLSRTSSVSVVLS
nr:MAG TPA: hypothetical protein [Caudoviricetes sp.]